MKPSKNRVGEIDRRVRFVHRACGRELVEPFVQPRVLELVVAHQAVPELVAGLVDGDVLRILDLRRRQPARARREQRRVLHAAGAALPGRIDDRDVAVRIGPEPLAVVLQRRPRRREMPVGLRRDARAAAAGAVRSRQRRVLEGRRLHDVVRAGRPHEIVDVFLHVAMRGRALGRVVPLALAPRRADHPAPRHGDPHVVDAVVGVELGAGMELVRVPAGVFENAQLGKPLRDEEVVADRAGAGEGARHSRRPGQLHGHRLAGRHGHGQRHRQHGAVGPVAVVGRDERAAGRQVGERRPAAGQQAYRRDVDMAPVTCRPLTGRIAVSAPGPPAGAQALAHPGGVGVAPRVPVEMKLQLAGGPRADVAPRDDTAAGDRA